MLSLGLVYYLRLPTHFFDKITGKTRNLRDEFAQMMDALLNPMQGAVSQSIWAILGNHSGASEVFTERK